ncbi:hypothetical protein Clacol_005539 [Clathrus columnatus]|uniref:F-box domain-containing protein n=1 Tax=Clathrus columnatus TaxID=1419009 RepID=A0AAV5ACJ2_9AGAM|nr:hypothetical protein Clacol_005539 [Clathrus columnatus]
MSSDTSIPVPNTTTTPRDTEELAQFRQRWKDEVRDRDRERDRRRKKGKARDVGKGDVQRPPILPGQKQTTVAAFGSLSSGVNSDDTNVNQTQNVTTSKPPNVLSTITSSSIPTQRISHLQPQSQLTSRQKLALEFYTSAILEEQRGDHPEATKLYRRAFRLDANVDKIHYRQEMAREKGLLSLADIGTLNSPTSPSPAVSPVISTPTPTTTAAASSLSLAVNFSHLGLDTHQHPYTHSSKILDSDLSSQSHPFDLRPLLSAWTDPIPEFLPSDDRLPVPLAKLPNELVIYILTTFLPHMDIASIEVFALACRKMRILTSDGSLWRKLLELNLVSYQLSDPSIPLDDLCLRYRSDYRRMFIEHPRVRFDGVYIAICHYVRNGLGENPWVTVSHLITYRRFLRFLPNGKVMSYQTNEDQEISDVVHSLQPSLVKKDLRIGDWQLFGTSVYITNLSDVVPSRFRGIVNEKYNYQMKLNLKSRPCLGRWNKLDMIGYESVDNETGDVSPFALRHERPYWFSKLYEDRRVKPCPLCNKLTKKASFVKLYIASSSSPLGTPVKPRCGNVDLDVDVDIKEGIKLRDALTGLTSGGEIDRNGLNRAINVSQTVTTFSENLGRTSDIELKCLAQELKDAFSRFQSILFPQLETLLTLRESIQVLQTRNENLETTLDQKKAELDTISRKRVRMEKENANLGMAKKLVEEKASVLERNLDVLKKLVDELQQTIKNKDALIKEKEEESVRFKGWLGDHKLKAEKYKAEVKRLEGVVYGLEQKLHLHSEPTSSSQPPPGNNGNDDDMVNLDEDDSDVPIQIQKKRKIDENGFVKPTMTGRWQPRAPPFVTNNKEQLRTLNSNSTLAQYLPLNLDNKGQAKATSSTLTPTRPQSLSYPRPSSRSSIRAASPAPPLNPEDPVVLRNQMSTLKHEIRQKQAQFNALETLLLRGPRPLPPSPPPPTEAHTSHISSSKISRRSSWEQLSTMTGPESHIPLPLPNHNLNGRSMKQEDVIKEGVPLEFGVSSLSASSSSTSMRRAESPTRSMSRIPVSSVGHARILADDGKPSDEALPSSSSTLDPALPQTPNNKRDYNYNRDSLSPLPPSTTPSSNASRRSIGGGNTTKVLADLQAGVMASRTALDNAKAQLRVSQRTVAQLTRQNEDLKEGRERLRLENEGLNNVVARKERLLQEVLERARKAESEAHTYKTQLKQETTSAKKSLREMESSLAESTALSVKSEREYITLRESIKHLTEGWKADLVRIKEDTQRKEKALRVEAENMGKKYDQLVKAVEEERNARLKAESLRDESRALDKQFEKALKEQIDILSSQIEKSTGDSQSAKRTAE